MMRECRSEGCPHLAADGLDFCFQHDEPPVCEECDGEGVVLGCASPYGSDHAYPTYEECPDCHGIAIGWRAGRVGEIEPIEEDNLLHQALEALRLMVEMHERHDRWCGYKADAPGDMLLNVALDRARDVLGGR